VLGVEEARTPEIVVAHLHVGIEARGLEGHLEAIEGPRGILDDRELAPERCEVTVHPTDDEVPNAEHHEGVHRIYVVDTRCR
jgi:hypothetical protein